MEVRLYTNTAPAQRANKSSYLTLLATVTGVNVYGDFDLQQPQLQMDANSNSLTANYCYIVELGRYYYIQKHVGRTATHVTLQLDLDRRYTYLNTVKNSDVVATRCNMYNKNIPDSMAMSIPQEKVTYRKLSSALTGENYILVVGG